MPRRKPSAPAVPGRPSRVVLYVRVSALMGRGGEDFHSPDVQISAMRRATVGMREVGVVEDIDRTGTNFERAGIEQVRRMARAGEIDAIAVYDVSRFGRDVLESLLVLRELSQSGVRIISACEHIDTSTPAGEMMLINLLNLAQYRAREIGRSWSNVIARRAEHGRHHGQPLGYIKRSKRLVPDPVIGPAMAEVFRRYAAGVPISEIARYLAAVRGKPALTANLKKCLRNPVYLGKVVAGGQVLPGQHDALVDEATWQRVQDRLAAEAGAPPRHLAPTWSLVGLVYCPYGHRLQRTPRRGIDRLVCGMGRGGVAGGCKGVGCPRLQPVEAEVLRQVSEWAQRLRTDHQERAARLARVAESRAGRAALEQRLRETRAAMVRLVKTHALDRLPAEVYQQAMAELREAEEAAAVELARMGAVEEHPDPEESANAADALLRLWPEMTYAERGRALRAIVDRIVVRGATRWREPESDRVDVHFRWS